FDEGDVRGTVRGGQEGRKTLLNVYPAQTHGKKEQTCHRSEAGEIDVEPAAERFEAYGHSPAGKIGVEPVDQLGCSCREILLETRSALREMLQHRMSGGEHERMPDEGSREEGRRYLGLGIVAEGPMPTVKRIHVLGLAGENADGHATADYLAVGG